MYVLYHGYVTIHYWEYLLSLVYMVVLYLVFARRKHIMLRTAPEYKYYLWGLWARVAGGIGFSLIYFFYYMGGDTIMYFYSAVSMAKLAFISPIKYLEVLVMPATQERLAYFTTETGWPFKVMYFGTRNFMLVRLISVVLLFTFKSYLVTTVVVGSLTYGGVWKCYRTFVGYYPALSRQLAIAFLFVPSVVFWGAAIMKDTFTFTGTCMLVHYSDEWLNKGNRGAGTLFGLIVSVVFLIMLKPYILIAMLPFILLWRYYARILAVRNSLFRFVVLPLGGVLIMAAAFGTLQVLGDRLDKFSMDEVLTTIVVTKNDMLREEEYGTNSFDIGTIENNWWSVLSKVPMALTAAMFRPFIWEARNIVMLVSGLENFVLLLLTLSVVVRLGPLRMVRYIAASPILILCTGFVFVLGVGVGVSTPVFGALVRFKIPFVPFLLAADFILLHLYGRYRDAERSGRVFQLSDYQAGDPDAYPPGKARRPHERRRPGPRPEPMHARS